MILLLGLACVLENSGPAPSDYGRACDPARPACSSGMECVSGEWHSELMFPDPVCSMPCDADSDCPEAVCLESSARPGQPYTCSDDGYCFIPGCEAP